jgi:DNA invertase Pin-like site-specific DNA recombinase
MNAEPIPVAQYLRMSTNLQQYSIANQTAALSAYAGVHGLDIVQTYVDSGRSGLMLKNRKALRQLLQDVVNNPPFKAIIVYDVSRWGRFQDPDEAAHYEFLCRQNGIQIHYCAEEFPNDLTLSSSILKFLKRTMAAEYSRELSVKVYSTLRRVAEAGHWAGSTPGYGFRRMLIAADGHRKQVLQNGEAKYLRSDRVSIVIGPPEEVSVVRLIYRMFLKDLLRPSQIVRELSRRGLSFDGRPWSFYAVKKILTDPKYCGVQLWGRTERKLKTPPKRLPKEQWVFAVTRGPRIVNQQTFERAQQRYFDRTDKKTNHQLLEQLRMLWRREGHLTAELIDASELTATVNTYRRRFGSVTKALELIGYRQQKKRIRCKIEESRGCSRRLRAHIIRQLTLLFPGRVRLGFRDGLVNLPEEDIDVVVAIARAYSVRGYPIWAVSPRREQSDSVTLLCLLDESNKGFRAFYVFSRLQVKHWTRIYKESEILSEGEKLLSLRSFYTAVVSANARIPQLQRVSKPSILIGVPEIARYLRQTPGIVRRLIREGMPTTRKDKYLTASPECLDQWIRENGTEWRPSRDTLGRYCSCSPTKE